MYLNKMQTETVFELVAKHSEKLSLGEYRLNFIATREELCDIMDKLAPTIKADGWSDSPEWTARVHRLALNNDLAERRAKFIAMAETAN
jgi:hypothetical protein